MTTHRAIGGIGRGVPIQPTGLSISGVNSMDSEFGTGGASRGVGNEQRNFGITDKNNGFGSSNFGSGADNGFGNSRGGGGSSTACRKCGQDGHFAYECPNDADTRTRNGCYKCGGDGHIAKNCPGGQEIGGSGGDFGVGGNDESGGGFGRGPGTAGRDGRACNKCHQEGHIARNCPNEDGNGGGGFGGGSGGGLGGGSGFGGGDNAESRPRGRTCYNCGEEGHVSKNCKEPRNPTNMEKKPLIFMVAEKPKMAYTVAMLLAGDRRKANWKTRPEPRKHRRHGDDRRRGDDKVKESRSFYVYEFDYGWARCWMTSTFGHISELRFRGHGVDNRKKTSGDGSLFTANVHKVDLDWELSQFLRAQADKCDYMVLWLDCDKPGENICFEVIEAVGWQRTDRIYRARFSAITKQDIQQAMRNLTRPNKSDALAIDARQELDYRIGCSFTRLMTQYCDMKYTLNVDEEIEPVSFGPCQTPALEFVVRRGDAVDKFKPTQYWELECDVTIERQVQGQSDDRLLKVKCGRRIEDAKESKTLLERLSNLREAEVVSVTTKTRTEPKPCALDTFELMRMASKLYECEPSKCMNVVEDLYIKGWISYPRTETTAYPKNYLQLAQDLHTAGWITDPNTKALSYEDKFTLVGALKAQVGNKEWGKKVTAILLPKAASGKIEPRKGVDAGDHPPITPLEGGDLDKMLLTQAHRELYRSICRHWLASLSDDCVYDTVTATFKIGGEQFSISENVVKKQGFMEFLRDKPIKEEKLGLSSLQPGRRLAFSRLELVEKCTESAGYLTVAELITKMETHRIGTNGSMAGHIAHLQIRGYVDVLPGQRLKPTALGRDVARLFERIAQGKLVKPTLRREVEEKLNSIRDEMDYEKVITQYVDEFETLFDEFLSKMEEWEKNAPDEFLIRNPKITRKWVPVAAPSLDMGNGK